MGGLGGPFPRTGARVASSPCGHAAVSAEKLLGLGNGGRGGWLTLGVCTTPTLHVGSLAHCITHLDLPRVVSTISFRTEKGIQDLTFNADIIFFLFKKCFTFSKCKRKKTNHYCHIHICCFFRLLIKKILAVSADSNT